MDSNPREELLERFRQSLRQPVLDRYFDEDELVELYDYAGDLNDDYIQMEVLFCGARLYPESRALSERRALLYLDTTIDDTDTPSPAAAKYLADNKNVNSPIFDIVRLETNRPPEPLKALDFIVSQYDNFADEDMIRLINLACDLDQFQWVKDNLALLRTKVSYPPVLLYEVMCEADERADDTLTIAMAEELIELEPFALGYWVTLFRAQVRAERVDDARATFDSASALGADNPEALMMLAESVYNSAPYLYKEAFEMLEGLSAQFPDDFRYVDCRLALLIRMGAVDRAAELLKTFIDEHPLDDKAMRQMLMLNMRGCRKYLDRFYMETYGVGFDEPVLEEMTNLLSLNNSSEALDALMTLTTLDPSECPPMEFSSWIEALFDLGKYDRIVSLVRQYKSLDVVLNAVLKGNAVIYSYLVSLMKLGRQEEAEDFIATIAPMLEETLCSAPMPVRMNIRFIQTLFDKIRRHPASDTLYWEVFDMLRYGKFR